MRLFISLLLGVFLFGCSGTELIPESIRDDLAIDTRKDQICLPANLKVFEEQKLPESTPDKLLVKDDQKTYNNFFILGTIAGLCFNDEIETVDVIFDKEIKATWNRKSFDRPLTFVEKVTFKNINTLNRLERGFFIFTFLNIGTLIVLTFCRK